MPRFTYMLNSFKSGELGPKVHGRTETEQYKDGLDTMQNFLPYQTGGAARRPGLYNHNTRQDSGTDTVDAERSLTIPYYLDQKNIFNVTLSYNKDTGDWDTSNVEAMKTEYATVAGSIGAGAGLALGAIDFAADDGIEGFSWAQVDNTIVLVHNSGLTQPIVLYPNISGTTITILTDTYLNKPVQYNKYIGVDHFLFYETWNKLPWNNPNTGTVTLTAGATSGTTTLTASSAIFDSNDLNKYYILDDGGQTAVFQVNSFSSSTVLNVTVIGVTGGFTTAATDYWYESSWGLKPGFPTCVEVHNGRLIFGGRNTIWASYPFQYGQFSRYMGFSVTSKGVPAYDRDPANIEGGLQLTINSQGDSDTIMWLKSNRSLLVGTRSREYVLNLQTGPSITPQSNNGSSPYRAANGFNSTFFIGNDGTSIYEVKYSEENGAFVSRELTNLNNEILHTGETDREARYIQLEWNEHFKTLFMLTSTGKVKCVTIEEDAGVTAMSSIATTNLTIYQVTRLYLPEQNFTYPLFKAESSDVSGNEAELFLVMCQNYEGSTPLTGTNGEYGSFACYLDFAYAQLTSFAATNSLTLPTEYTDMTLTFIGEQADGTIVIEEDITLSGTTATLTNNVIKYVAGLKYTSQLKTLTPEVGPNQVLNSQGDVIRIDRITAKLFKSWVGKYGSDESTYDFENLSIQTPFTGEERLDIPLGPDNENKAIIQTDQPLPLNVLALVMRGQHNP